MVLVHNKVLRSYAEEIAGLERFKAMSLNAINRDGVNSLGGFMTEENLNTETTAPVTAEANVSTEQPSAPSIQPAPSAPTEKTLTQSEVNKLVGNVKRETYEKAKRDVMADAQPQVQTQVATAAPTESVSPENIRKMINEEAQKMAEMQTAQQVVNQFVEKMETGKEQYEDFDQVVEQLNLPTMPQVIHYANALPNTSDIMYELGKNPSKVASLMNVIQYTPQLASQEFKKLSDSITANKEAVNAKKAKEPLSQVEASYTGVDSGDSSVSDLRKQSYLR